MSESEPAEREVEGEHTGAPGSLRDQLRKIGTFRWQYELFREKLLPLVRKTAETPQVNYRADKASFVELIAAQWMLRDVEATASTQLADYLATLAEMEAIVGFDLLMPDSSRTSVAPVKWRHP